MLFRPFIQCPPMPMPVMSYGTDIIDAAACRLNIRDLAIALGTYQMPTKPQSAACSQAQLKSTPMLIFARHANLQGVSVGSTQTFEAMNRAIAVSKLELIIDKVFSFDDTPAAYRYLQSAQHFGKVVIRLGSMVAGS
jgi:threonine dehydrogenase-like Zn-dependent dehydrogenase